MRYLIKFSYDGSTFFGFQRQKNQKTVQGELEKALSKILNQEIKIKGSGRTDTGVHAYNQVAHFDMDFDIKNITKELNKILVNIKVKTIKKVDGNFHARYSIKEKTYIYKISYNSQSNPQYYLIVRKKLNLKKMREAAKYFVKTHNFQNFISRERINYETTIYKIKIKKRGTKLIIQFTGRGFYRYMVRNLVGALIDVGKNNVEPQTIKIMLEEPKKSKQLSTALANGVYLKKIKY